MKSNQAAPQGPTTVQSVQHRPYREPPTESERLIEKVKAAVKSNSPELPTLALKMCDEYRSAVAVSIRLESCLHTALKRLEDLEHGKD